MIGDAVSRAASATPVPAASEVTEGVVWAARDTVALLLVALGGALVRLVRLARPGGIIFDEFYAQDACWYVHASTALCGASKYGGVQGITEEITIMHPPLGKWLIAAGIRLLGYDPVGWRIASVAAGVMTIILLYLLAHRLLRSTRAASIAGSLLAIDFLHFVHSRVAMLDVFMTLFGVAAVLFCVYDSDFALRSGSRQHRRSGARWIIRRPWRIAAGAAAGAAIASKWPGLSFLLIIAVVDLAREVWARRQDGQGKAFGRTIREEGPGLILWFVVLPVFVYVATFVAVVPGDILAWPWARTSWLRAVLSRHLFMLRWHFHDFGIHPYQSPPWSWLLLMRPVVFYMSRSGGHYREVLAVGSPLVWWSSVLAVGYTALVWFRRRSAVGPEVVILAGFLFTYGPWLVLAGNRTYMFLYYLLPTVPFLYLAVAYVTTFLDRSSRARTMLAGFLTLAVGLFVFYYPLLAVVPLSPNAWRARIAIFADCGPSSQQPAAGSVSGSEGSPQRSEPGRQGPRARGDSTPPGSQPISPLHGWCWI